MKKARVMIVMAFIILVIGVASIINLVIHYGTRLSPAKLGEMGNQVIHNKIQQLHNFGAQPYWLIPLVGGIIVLYILFSMINSSRIRRSFRKTHNRFR